MIGRIPFVVILFISLTSALSVESSAKCHPGFSEKVTVKVYDANGFLIEGALVNITYQKDITTGKGYVTSPNVYTNASGMASFLVVNTETIESRVRCDYTIRASYGGISSKLETYYSMPQPFGITIEVYEVIIKLLDRYQKTIKEGSVSSNGIPCTQRGDYSWRCYGGKNTIFKVVFGNSIKEIEEDITNNTYKFYVLDVYQAKVIMKDDKGKPVSGFVKIGEITYDINGEAEVVSYRQAEVVRAEWFGIVKEKVVDFGANDVIPIVFDVHSPEIGYTTVEGSDENTKMVIKSHITDTIGVSNAKILYTVGGKSSQVSGIRRGDTYEFIIPVPKDYRIVSLTILASDAEGNTAHRSGTITITEINKEEDNTKISDMNKEQQSNEGINILFVVAGIVLILLVLVIVFFLRSIRGNQ